MREWDILIKGDGPLLDAAWAETLAGVLMPYAGTARVEEGRATIEMTVRTENARLATHLALHIWYTMAPHAQLTSLLVCQDFTTQASRHARAAARSSQPTALLRPEALAG